MAGITTQNSLKSGTIQLTAGTTSTIELGSGVLIVLTNGGQAVRVYGIDYWSTNITEIFSSGGGFGATLSKVANSTTISFTPSTSRTVRYVYIGE